MDLLIKRYYIPGITVYVVKCLACCHGCQTIKPVGIEIANIVLHPIPVPPEIWNQIGINIIGPLVK